MTDQLAPGMSRHSGSSKRWAMVGSKAGFEGRYQASSEGQIRSLAREYINARGAHRKTPERILSACAGGGRYLNVSLFRDSSTPVSWKVHQLVCRTFHGDKPFPEAVIRHLDGNSFNNRASNLRWGTPAENSRDLVRHGRNHNANKDGCINGHEYTPDNVVYYTTPGGQQMRKCRACKRNWSRKDYVPKRGRRR